MQEFNIESTNLATSEMITESAIRDTDFSNRKGYSADFLNVNLPLPMVNDDLIENVAINQHPSQNGEYYLDYNHFSILFNKNKKLPFFTAVNIEGKNNELARVHDARGGDTWYTDKRIEIDGDSFQFANSNYRNSGFQKGHMVRFYDPAWGSSEEQIKVAKGDTFHFTNCCPQIAKLNVGVWNDLEDYYMARSIFQDDKITVFTGPIFNKAKTIDRLLVPLNFWKVIVYNTDEGIEAMGFLISHEFAMQKIVERLMLLEEQRQVNPTLGEEDIERLFEEKSIKKFMVKIQLIEEKTGINFGLNDVDINRDETRLFYENADHVNALNPVSTFDRIIAKNKKPDELITKPKRMKYLMNYNEFINEEHHVETDYTEFIGNI
jgi:endonuclease G